MAKIPAEVWRFCVSQIKEYPLREANLNEEIRQAQLTYLAGGGNRKIDPSGVIPEGYSTSPIAVKYEAQEAYLDQPDIRYLARSVQKIQDIMQGMEKIERDVLESIWQVGWRDNGAIAREAKVSAATVKRAKHEIIKRLAVRWGMW